MDWQTPEDTVPSTFITEAYARAILGKPPATGAWREGDTLATASSCRSEPSRSSAATNCRTSESPTRHSAP